MIMNVLMKELKQKFNYEYEFGDQYMIYKNKENEEFLIIVSKNRNPRVVRVGGISQELNL